MAVPKAALAAGLVLSLLSFAAPATEATLLRGYVNETQEQSREAAAEEQLSRAQKGSGKSDSFPAAYEGAWKCHSEVTNSAVHSVPAGQKMISEIQFEKRADGRIIANWNQPGWTETQVSTVCFNPREASTDRTNYYFGEGMQGSWAARSRDKFVQVTPNRMVCQSYIDQYIDGHYLGRYRTKSVLYRLPVAVNDNVALNP